MNKEQMVLKTIKLVDHIKKLLLVYIKAENNKEEAEHVINSALTTLLSESLAATILSSTNGMPSEDEINSFTNGVKTLLEVSIKEAVTIMAEEEALKETVVTNN